MVPTAPLVAIRTCCNIFFDHDSISTISGWWYRAIATDNTAVTINVIKPAGGGTVQIIFFNSHTYLGFQLIIFHYHVNSQHDPSDSMFPSPYVM